MDKGDNAVNTNTHGSVLVVDDDQTIRGLLRWVLEYAGYAVVEAGSGVEALAILRTSVQPLVVLLDLLTPECDGHEVLNIVSTDRHLATYHAYVLITGDADLLTPGARAALATLGVPIVAKPVNLDVLYKSVAQAVSHLGRARPG
jgi:CheY-like chemotaxis protein